ncbi:high-affinity nicotinic acid transporter [Durotheca rogersii]|uniref:high-affinity nicotinic acid transporter n=1 Tax=Durotheca rogersii TaxID=419775 RepID=UPI00221E8C99|nr:high-affinity nicotinic acid transporter [Durotheca rogersii]KAI5860500.1 high-affinity nicotinic acid transporter [Durotheca rogersii]
MKSMEKDGRALSIREAAGPGAGGDKAMLGASSASTGLVEAQEEQFDEKETRRLLRKIDWHVIPIMSVVCLLCFLDRSNIGNARLHHLEQDLGLVGLQYNNCLAILFPFYIAAEIPSNMMMKRIRPSTWLAFIMLCWSVCTVGQGFVRSYGGLLATRALIGAFEGGLFPGINFYITQWYRRSECAVRMAAFFGGATVAGAFGGLLARGIAEADGAAGLAAWSWIFIIEGLLSLLVSFAAFRLISDYYPTAKFLTTAERREVARRLTGDSFAGDPTTAAAATASDDFDSRYVWQALADWKIYVHMLICMAAFCPIYSFSMFLPTIVADMGYSAHDAQLVSVPPYVFACLFSVGGCWLADRARARGVFLLAFQAVAALGLALLAAAPDPKTRYAGTVVAAIGIYPQIPLGLAWNSNNIGGSLKRATGIAMQAMGGNCGGIVASYVYLAPDAPRYTAGHSILVGFVGIAFLSTLFMTTWYRRENARRDAAAASSPGTKTTPERTALDVGLADDAPSFRYTV